MPRRKTRVALVTDAIAPWHKGGKETYYLEFVRRLTEHVEIHVYTQKWWDGPTIYREGEVTYHGIAPRRSLYSGGRRSIRQAVVFAICCLRLLFESFDVIEADHMPYLQLFSLRLVASLRRKRLIVVWHECWGPDYWRTYLGQGGRIGWLIESLAMRLPDAIISASPFTAERLQEFTHGRVEVTTATLGIDLATFSGIEPAQDSADVVTVSRLLPHKRIDLLLEALAILREEGRAVTARIVGSGPQLEALTTQARALGIADFVDFRQDIADQRDLYSVLKAARVAVFPSEREGFGIALLEALACGVPVVTTSAPDNHAQRLLTGRENGVVCGATAPALADAIAAMIDREQTYQRVDAEWLQQFDWATITETVARALI
jgi:glycosyltransferase involved in cell wall biosynthesis